MLMFSVKEHGVSRVYFTTAPIQDLTRFFERSTSKMDLFAYINENGYEVTQQKPSVRLNFDNR